MIIVSQDSKTILNLNNLQNIRIERYSTHQKGKYIYKIFGGNFEGYATEMGTYETEERAKEVLNQIVKKYADCLYSDDGYGSFQTITIPPKVYKMPEE